MILWFVVLGSYMVLGLLTLVAATFKWGEEDNR